MVIISKKSININKINNWTKQNLNFKIKKKKIAFTKAFQQIKLQKYKLILREKIFYYYHNKISLSYYTHKAFIILEMQLGVILQRTRLIPYFFIARDLCFYRTVFVNYCVNNSPFTIIMLYDIVSIPVALYHKFNFRYNRLQYFPIKLAFFFKNYWSALLNYRNNKVWILSAFISSFITAETIIFDYPNLILYSAPFLRFTKLYSRTQPLTQNWKQWQFITYSQASLKIRLFDYVAFYKKLY